MTPRPYTLVAELTHRCPLACPYCANPLALVPGRRELDTATWVRVFREAEDLGVVQVHLTGGEPLVRADLEEIVATARGLGLYTHLVTSGVPLGAARLERLVACGLDAVQLSLQDVDDAAADAIAGAPVARHKHEVARRLRALGVPVTVNVVLHRANIEHVGALVELGEQLGASRLELANAQYLGWALANRAAVLPPVAAVDRARDEAGRARHRLRGTMEITFVLPDYHRGRPKPCMDGWGRRYVVVTPDGRVQPCHLAHTIAGLALPNVEDGSLAELWATSAAFTRFRGEDWMPEPCRSCPERSVDFGGCRCQAFALTGDAAVTDPACRLSPHHALVTGAREAAETNAGAAVLRARTGPEH